LFDAKHPSLARSTLHSWWEMEWPNRHHILPHHYGFSSNKNWCPSPQQ
jgi:hypothetical protein